MIRGNIWQQTNLTENEYFYAVLHLLGTLFKKYSFHLKKDVAHARAESEYMTMMRDQICIFG